MNHIFFCITWTVGHACAAYWKHQDALWEEDKLSEGVRWSAVCWETLSPIIREDLTLTHA